MFMVLFPVNLFKTELFSSDHSDFSLVCRRQTGPGGAHNSIQGAVVEGLQSGRDRDRFRNVETVDAARTRKLCSFMST